MKQQTKVRHWAHIALGIVLPWLPIGSNIGGVIIFCAYQNLQYRYCSKRVKDGFYKDDSYLDLKEAAIPYAISAVVRLILWYLGYPVHIDR